MNHIDDGVGGGGCGVSGHCSHGDSGGGGGSSIGGGISGCVNDCSTEHVGKCGLLIYKENVICV